MVETAINPFQVIEPINSRDLSYELFPSDSAYKKIDLNADSYISPEEAANAVYEDEANAQLLGSLVDYHGVMHSSQLRDWWQLSAYASKLYGPNFDLRKKVLPYIQQDPSYSINIEAGTVSIYQYTFTVTADDYSPTGDELNEIGQALAVIDPDDLKAFAEGTGWTESKLKIHLVLEFDKKGEIKGKYRKTSNRLLLTRNAELASILHEINHAIDDFRAPTIAKGLQEGLASFDPAHPFFSHERYLNCQIPESKIMKRSSNPFYNLWLGALSIVSRNRVDRILAEEEMALMSLERADGVISSYSCQSPQEGIAEWHYYSGGELLDDFFAVSEQRANHWDDLNFDQKLRLEQSLEAYLSSGDADIAAKAKSILDRMPVL